MLENPALHWRAAGRFDVFCTISGAVTGAAAVMGVGVGAVFPREEAGLETWLARCSADDCFGRGGPAEGGHGGGRGMHRPLYLFWIFNLSVCGRRQL